MTAVEKALSFSVDGSAFIKQRYFPLNIDQILALNHVTLDSDFDITMNGTKVPGLMVGSLRPAYNGAYIGLTATLISHLGNIGAPGAPFTLSAPETVLRTGGSAWLNLLTGGSLSGFAGGEAQVTSGGSLRLNGLTVAGLAEHGITQRELAKKLGTHPVVVNSTIHNPNVKVSTLQRYADAIGCTVEDFFSR
jgi:hypothetical protein